MDYKVMKKIDDVPRGKAILWMRVIVGLNGCIQVKKMEHP